MNRAELKTRAKALLKPQFVTVLLAAIISDLLIGLLSSGPAVNVFPKDGQAFTFSFSFSTSGMSLIGTIIALVIAGPLAVGATKIFATVTAGQTAKLEQMFDPFKTNFVTCFLANLVSGIFIALYSLLLIVPGVMKAYSYAMVPYVLVKEPQLSAMEALHRSESLMKGHRMELFMLHLSFIAWMLLVIVTLGLALLWVAPYANVTETLFFDKIYGAAE